MLISITERCRMGCLHCLDDARADSDRFMSMEMFKSVLDFNFRYDPTITITGGEPTEHPQFWEFMKLISEKMKDTNVCSIVSNGMNLSDSDISKVIELRKSDGVFAWQISSIEPYYPIKINLDQQIFKLPEFVIENEIQVLEPVGRAKNHKDWNFNAKAPQCFNVRSMVRSTQNFPTTILLLRSKGRFCTPQIGYDGSIKLGESTLCPAVAHITDSEKNIVKKINNFRCEGCKGLLDKLPQNYRNAIGED